MINSDLDLVFEEYGDGSITHTKSYENSKKEGFSDLMMLGMLFRKLQERRKLQIDFVKVFCGIFNNIVYQTQEVLAVV